ncbi:hypothetical protein Gotur_023077 [Gossypium turneri]
MITGLQETLPKSIGLLPFDGGVTGCMRLVKEQLSWGTKSELKAEVLRGIKEIGKRAGYHTFHANSTLVGLASWCRWANAFTKCWRESCCQPLQICYSCNCVKP